MVKYDITLDGVSAEDAGIMFLSSLNLSEPVPRVTVYSVPGRNGDVHIYDGSFKNRTATIDGCLYREDFVKSKFAAVNAWLFGTLGYRKLKTDDDPTHYLMARITNGPEIAAKARKVAPFRIKFDCKPQRYLTSGDLPISVTSYGIYFNSPSAFPSKPLLEINFNSKTAKGSLLFNGAEVSLDLLKVANYSKVFYDSETEVTYVVQDDNIIHSYDGVIFNGENATIQPGANEVRFSGDITSLEIFPRWWDL